MSEIDRSDSIARFFFETRCWAYLLREKTKPTIVRVISETNLKDQINQTYRTYEALQNKISLDVTTTNCALVEPHSGKNYLIVIKLQSNSQRSP
jgi:hypothetical protein